VLCPRCPAGCACACVSLYATQIEEQVQKSCAGDFSRRTLKDVVVWLRRTVFPFLSSVLEGADVASTPACAEQGAATPGSVQRSDGDGEGAVDHNDSARRAPAAQLGVSWAASTAGGLELPTHEADEEEEEEEGNEGKRRAGGTAGGTAVGRVSALNLSGVGSADYSLLHDSVLDPGGMDDGLDAEYDDGTGGIACTDQVYWARSSGTTETAAADHDMSVAVWQAKLEFRVHDVRVSLACVSSRPRVLCREWGCPTLCSVAIDTLSWSLCVWDCGVIQTFCRARVAQLFDMISTFPARCALSPPPHTHTHAHTHARAHTHWTAALLVNPAHASDLLSLSLPRLFRVCAYPRAGPVSAPWTARPRSLTSAQPCVG